jgi:hypothetical protein
MSDSQINYRRAYFQHPSLSEDSGGPTTPGSQSSLKKECKANGKSVRPTVAASKDIL